MLRHEDLLEMHFKTTFDIDTPLEMDLMKPQEGTDICRPLEARLLSSRHRPILVSLLMIPIHFVRPQDGWIYMGSDRLDAFELVGNVMAGLHIAGHGLIPITGSLFVRAGLEDHMSDNVLG
jgi:hypothetical protein